MIEADGRDATDTITSFINELDSPVNYIMTDGITAGGFNMINIRAINQRAGTPVIAVTRTDPDFDRIENALSSLDDKAERKEVIEAAGTVHKATVNSQPVFFQTAGITEDDACAVIRDHATEGVIPEPVRVADLIGSGIQEVWQ